MQMQYKKILVIGDMHIPYHHKDSMAFLKSIKKESTRVLT